jgi:hypothetical protein
MPACSILLANKPRSAQLAPPHEFSPLQTPDERSVIVSGAASVAGSEKSRVASLANLAERSTRSRLASHTGDTASVRGDTASLAEED